MDIVCPVCGQSNNSNDPAFHYVHMMGHLIEKLDTLNILVEVLRNMDENLWAALGERRSS